MNNNRILWLPFVVMKENIGNSYVISSASYINNSSSNINPNGSPTATSPTNNRRRARNSIMLDNKDKDQKVSSNKNMGECPTVKNTGKLIAG